MVHDTSSMAPSEDFLQTSMFTFAKLYYNYAYSFHGRVTPGTLAYSALFHLCLLGAWYIVANFKIIFIFGTH